jgi:hypothetical protein
VAARHRVVLGACLAQVFVLAASLVFAAGRYDPALRFRVLRTPHFTIYYHQGEAAMAGRLAGIAERVREDLAQRTGLVAPSHTHVVLVDQSDIANGWSTPVPYNLVEIAAIPPAPSDFLGHHDDWLQMVFAHEYAHILHLDRVGGVMKGVRWTLGRSPLTFPNLFVPQWAVEGFATWAETAVTGFGRGRAADVGQVVAAAAAAGGASIDRAGGGLVAWPSGHAAYFLGGRFTATLAERYSPKALGDLSRETARRIPFLGGGAYSKVFGAPAGELWRGVFSRTAAATPGLTEITRLTRDGFMVSGPRVIRTRRHDGGQTESVVYSSQGPHRFPDIRRVGLDGGATERLATRVDGQVASSDGRWLYFDQLEFRGASAIVADLYARDLESGHVRRLSHGQRLTDPDVDTAGVRLAAVRARDGEKRLTVWRIGRTADGRPELPLDPERTLGDANCQYASPRWSPDGSQIAAVRQCLGSLPAVVVLGARGGFERVIAAGSRNLTPAWTLDGRTVLFASDREDQRFKLFAAGVPAGDGQAGAPVLVLDAPGGVLWPDLAAGGRTVVFTSLTADGYDVFAARLPELPGRPASHAPTASDPAERPPIQPPPPGPVEPVNAAAPASDPYSPWRTLLPRAWSPIVTLGDEALEAGVEVHGTDVLGYHEYAGSATWRASRVPADVSFDSPPLGWSIDYAYVRWRPSLLLSAWETLDSVSVVANTSRVTFTSEERARGLFGGAMIPWRRARLAQDLLMGVSADERRLPAAARVADRSRNAYRAGWALNSSRQYGYSISPEDGIKAALNVERVTPQLGADGHAVTTTADLRGYLHGFRMHHVVAARLAVAESTGDASMKRVFSLGSSGVPPGAFDMGRRAVGLVRGLPSDERMGAAALVGNLDYRFPILRVERGIRTWPVFLRDLHGAVFADVGSAGRSIDALPAAVLSSGGEIGGRFTFGYIWNVNLAAGAAWIHDPTRLDRVDRVALFVRTGYAF